MNPTVRQAVLRPATWKPQLLPGLAILLDRYSPYVRAAGMASQFNVAGLRYLSHAGNAQLWGAVAGWWRSVWVYTDSKLADQVVMTCSTILDNVGYDVRQLTASGKYQLTVGNGAAEKTALSAATPGNASWHQIYIEYDGTNIGISVDNEAIVQTALAAAYSPGANGFNVGASLTPLLYFDGRMQCLCGGDGVLTTAQRTAMYNSGTPLAYNQIAGVVSQTPTFFMFEMNEVSGARGDLGWAALSLTNNNSVGTAFGTVPNACNSWTERAKGTDFAADAQTNRPVIRPGGMEFDGTNDRLEVASGGILTGLSGLVVAKVTVLGTPSSQAILSSSDVGTTTSLIALWARYNDVTPTMTSNQISAGVGQDFIHGSTSITAPSTHLFLFQSNGSNYTFRRNGSVETKTVEIGADSGDWFGDTALRDNTEIGGLEHSGGSTQHLQGRIAFLAAIEPDPPPHLIPMLERYVAREYAMVLQ